jgi:hypothetical protein
MIRHWAETAYIKPLFQKRLDEVKRQIRVTLDECPPGPLRIISLCSGDGRDLLGVVPDHARRPDVSCLLVDANPEAIVDAKAAASAVGLEKQFRCVVGDAACLDHYESFGPAHLIIISGVFVYLMPADAERLIAALPMLGHTGFYVIWNRRLPQSPDKEIFRKGSVVVEDLQNFFRLYDFRTVTNSATGVDGFAVRREKFYGTTRPWKLGAPLFKFFRPVPVDAAPLLPRPSFLKQIGDWLKQRLHHP